MSTVNINLQAKDLTASGGQGVVDPTPDTLVQRTSTGAVKATDATTDNEAVNKGQMDTALDDKVDKTTESAKIYGTDGNGMPILYTQTANETTPDSVPLRNSNGAIVANAAQQDMEVVNLAQMNIGLRDKVDKTTARQVVYAHDSAGKDIALSYDSEATVGVAVRGQNGVLKVGAPVANNDATTKEYVDTNIEDIKAYLGYMDEDIAGICVDYQNKTFERLAGAYNKSAGEDFNVFPMFGGRRRCNVANDGTINAYYGDENYVEDGSNGQVMVYQPKFYYNVTPVKKEKNTTSGLGYHLRKANYYVSSKPKTGFKLHPAFYDANGNEVDYILLSAYEGSMWDASQNKYINDNVDESIAYAAGDLLCSIAGKKPISGLRSGMGTKANFESMAQNRGAGWHLETIKATSANQLLMIIEIGMMNTQTGIGQGVVSITDNSFYNCSSLTGSTANLGNGTGQAAETINETGGVETPYTDAGRVSVSYRGVENPWGNIWKHIQGVNIWGDGSMAGGQPFVCDNLTDFNESSHSDHYHGVGFTLANSDGYINAMGYGNEEFDWLLMPSENGGTSALPVGDYIYTVENLNSYKVALLGGSWSTGADAGGFCWYCHEGVGIRYRDIGGRLLYVPSATV